VVCPAEAAPRGARVERGWRCLEIEGPIPLSEAGVLASVAGPLARAGVGVFVVSTFDTDYVLVQEADLARAVRAPRAAGHAVAERASRASTPPP
jgi:hypothetical protein